mmetsp:Transcript_22103/g.22409  ORF Transcript_22103/g.22409 Transcript_22103/m.22409 type:complete len:94 (+) Transcript_22103:466-747(+)
MHQTCRDKNESTVLFLFFDDTEDESTKQKVKSSEVKSMVYICSLTFFLFLFPFCVRISHSRFASERIDRERFDRESAQADQERCWPRSRTHTT